MYTVEIGNSIVHVKRGDITKQITDAIVNLNDETLFHNSGVSKAILAAAGKSVYEELSHLDKSPKGDVVVTNAGDLRCKKIIHMISIINEKKIVAGVTKVLRECDQHNLQSVTFPAIATGNACIKANKSLESILTGIKEYMLCTTTSCIANIYIIAYSENVYNQYVKAFEKISVNQAYNLNIKIYGKIVTLTKGDITQQEADCIVNLTNKTLDRNWGVSGKILSAAGRSVKDECKHLGPITTDSIVLTNSGNLKCKKILHLIGPTTSDGMLHALEKILEECVKHSIQTVALPAIGTGYAGIDLNESVSRTIEGLIQHFEKVALTSLTKISIVAFKDKIYQAYAQAFKNKEQSDPYSEDKVEDGVSDHICKLERVRRRSNNSQTTKKKTEKCLRKMPRNPLTWTDMGNDKFKTVELSRDSIEFKDVENKFLESSQPLKFKVIKIKRVQNEKLWRSYCVRQVSVSQRHQYEVNERLLFHGTCLEKIPEIIRYGFNRSYCGKNGLAYGHGTYFALNALYSCRDTYSVRDKDGNKHIILAAVVTGTWRQGERHYIDAPPTEEDPETRCDCVVNDVNNPTVFVIFCDDGAYPKYIITFK